MKFREKLVVIEAKQWFKPGDHIEVLWAPVGYDKIPEFKIGYHGGIKTRDGWRMVTPGDWIITTADGELYLCTDEIFKMKYEPVEEA